jgi:RHS repeat-associated protein
MEYDSGTGLYYDHARYYDSVTGRFVSQDPKGFAAGDTNLYRYSGNQPTSSTDPTGTIDWGPKGGKLTIDPNFNPGGLKIEWIPEDYKGELPNLPMKRRLPPNGSTDNLTDAVLIESIGMYKLRNGNSGLLTNDPVTGKPIVVGTKYRRIVVGPPIILGPGISITPTATVPNGLYPVGSPNPFQTDIPKGNVDEGTLGKPWIWDLGKPF